MESSKKYACHVYEKMPKLISRFNRTKEGERESVLEETTFCSRNQPHRPNCNIVKLNRRQQPVEIRTKDLLWFLALITNLFHAPFSCEIRMSAKIVFSCSKQDEKWMRPSISRRGRNAMASHRRKVRTGAEHLGRHPKRRGQRN